MIAKSPIQADEIDEYKSLVRRMGKNSFRGLSEFDREMLFSGAHSRPSRKWLEGQMHRHCSGPSPGYHQKL
jgi:hypothetical protein